MSTEMVIKASEIPRIKHDEAMAITAAENRRLWELLIDIKPDEWSLPTDCTRWDVRAIVVHLRHRHRSWSSCGKRWPVGSSWKKSAVSTPLME